MRVHHSHGDELTDLLTHHQYDEMSPSSECETARTGAVLNPSSAKAILSVDNNQMMGYGVSSNLLSGFQNIAAGTTTKV